MTADSTSTMGASHQPDELLLTVEEAARRLQLGRTLLYRLISSGDLESVTVGRLRRLLPAGVRGDGARRRRTPEPGHLCHTRRPILTCRRQARSDSTMRPAASVRRRGKQQCASSQSAGVGKAFLFDEELEQ